MLNNPTLHQHTNMVWLYTAANICTKFHSSPSNSSSVGKTVHTAQLCTSSTFLSPSLGWQIQTTAKCFYLTIQNNGGTSVALGKHRHWLHMLPAFRGLSLIREIGQCFLQQGPGGWHKWDWQRNTKQMRGAPASDVPLLRDHAQWWKQTSTVLGEMADCVSAGVPVVSRRPSPK